MVIKQYIAELIGSFFLVFLGCGAYSIYGLIFEPSDKYLEISIVFGLTYLSLYQVFSKISSCVFNPTNSLALLLLRRLSPSRFFEYLAAQISGALLATLLLNWIVTNNINFSYSEGLYGGGGLISPTDISFLSVLILKTVIIFFLVVVFVKSTNFVTSSNTILNGLAIANSLLVGVLFSLPITKSSINPLIGVSFHIVTGNFSVQNFVLIFVPDLFAAFLGAVFVKYFFTQSNR